MFSNINEIRKNLEKYYNASFLNNVSDDIKETLKNVVTEAKDSGKGNVPLINIIYNYFYGVLPSPKYISGPFTLSYHTHEIYDMKIYIFGERHDGKEGQCSELYPDNSSYLDISEYLHKVFLNSDKFIDFYLEDYLFSNVKSDRNTFLAMLRDDFNTCLHPNTRFACIYKTIRTHFIDVRMEQKESILIDTSPFGKFHTFILDQLNGLYDDYEYYEYDEYNELRIFAIQLYNCKDTTDIAMLLINIAKEIPIIKKALKRCFLGEELVLSFFSSHLPRIYSTYDISNFQTEIRKFITRNPYVNFNILHMIVGLESPMVDIYTICRMFKIFNNKNNLPIKPRHIIYYGGNNHSKMIREFLEFLNFKNHINIQQDTTTKCLDMMGAKLDFEI